MTNKKRRSGQTKILQQAAFSAFVLGLGATADFATPAAAQTTAQLKARCSQLMAYYDRFGVGRSLHSDGRRSPIRMAAEVDCSKGLYAEGIAALETLLLQKKFTPPPSGLPDEPDVDE